MRLELIDLDEAVVRALELFVRSGVPSVDFKVFRRPLVVGSGNAAATGRILFRDKDAVFADEGTYQKRLDGAAGIDGAFLISAAGGKHAPGIARELKARGLETVLLTCNAEAPAKRYATKTFVFPKLPEPYTYNTSTYIGMILSSTGEDPRAILRHIRGRVAPLIPKELSAYDAFFFIVPAEFECIKEMLLTKFDELFGPKVNGRAFTPEQVKHSKTVVASDTELFIGLGYENRIWGKNRLNVPLPANVGYAAVMAGGYYIIGHIQKQHPPYFKESIGAYARKTSEVFGETITPMVY